MKLCVAIHKQFAPWLLHFFACSLLVSIAGEDTTCGTGDLIECCPPDVNRPLHCLRQTFEARKNSSDCKCATSKNSDSVNYCGWNRKLETRSQNGERCEFNPEPCAHKTTVNKWDDMTCLPGGVYPPRKGDEELYCDFTHDVAGVTNAIKDVEKLFYNDQLFYRMIFTCWLHVCRGRLMIPKEAKPTIRIGGDDYYWCYPTKYFDGNVPYTGASNKNDSAEFILDEEGSAEDPDVFYGTDDDEQVGGRNASLDGIPRNITYCPLYDVDAKNCVRPPLCNTGGQIDRKRYMVPMVDGELNYQYCERLCTDDMTNENYGKRVATLPDGQKCLVIPACRITVDGLVVPFQYKEHLIPHCIPLGVRKNCPPINLDSPWPFTFVKGLCLKLPKCLPDGQLPAFGELNPYNATKCTPLPPFPFWAITFGVGTIIVLTVLLLGSWYFLWNKKELGPQFERWYKEKGLHRLFKRMDPLLANMTLEELPANLPEPIVLGENPRPTVDKLFEHLEAMKAALPGICGKVDLAHLKEQMRAVVQYANGHDRAAQVGTKYITNRLREIGTGLKIVSEMRSLQQYVKEHNVFGGRKLREIPSLKTSVQQCRFVWRLFAGPEMEMVDFYKKHLTPESLPCVYYHMRARMACAYRNTAANNATIRDMPAVNRLARLAVAARPRRRR